MVIFIGGSFLMRTHGTRRQCSARARGCKSQASLSLLWSPLGRDLTSIEDHIRTDVRNTMANCGSDSDSLQLSPTGRGRGAAYHLDGTMSDQDRGLTQDVRVIATDAQARAHILGLAVHIYGEEPEEMVATISLAGGQGS